MTGCACNPVFPPVPSRMRSIRTEGSDLLAFHSLQIVPSDRERAGFGVKDWADGREGCDPFGEPARIRSRLLRNLIHKAAIP